MDGHDQQAVVQRKDHQQESELIVTPATVTGMYVPLLHEGSLGQLRQLQAQGCVWISGGAATASPHDCQPASDALL